MSTEFFLRNGVPADARVLAQMRYEFRSALDAVVEDSSTFIERAGTKFAALLASDRWMCWVIELRDGLIVGHCFLQRIEKLPNPVSEAEWIGYITNVYVAPTYRGNGCASRMLDAALRYCREHGAYSAILWPTDESRPMYERRGFRVPNRLIEMPCFTNMQSIPPISSVL